MDTSRTNPLPARTHDADADADAETPLPLDPREVASALQHLAPLQQLRALVEHPRARDAVAALAPLPLFHLIRTLGDESCTDLLHLASQEQVQAFIDLECWSHDALDGARFAHWLNLLLEQPDDDNLRRQLLGLDREDLVLFLQEHVAVFVFDEDDEPPHDLLELGRDWEESPDHLYKLIFGDDEDANRLIRRFLQRLYDVDIDLARLLLDASRLELRAPIEEAAYHLRTGRLEDLGFPPREEALALYAPAHPEPLKRALLDALGQPTPAPRPPEDAFLLPAPFQEAAERAPAFFTQALQRLNQRPDVDQDTLQRRIAALTQKALTADAVPPGDLEAIRHAAQRVLATLSLGLQHAADSDLDRAADLLQRAWPHDLFRLGFALTLGLRRQAEQLLAGGTLRDTLSITQSPLSLLPEHARLTLDPLLQPRPEYGDPLLGYAVPFSELDQLHRTAARLSLVGFQVMALFGVLRLDRDTIAALAYQDHTLPPVEQLSTETLLATALALAALGHPPTPLRHLTLTEVAHLLRGPLHEAHRLLAKLPEPRPIPALAPLDDTLLGRRAIALLTEGDALSPQMLPIVRTTARRLIERLDDLLGDLDPEDLDPASLGDALLVTVKATPPAP